MFRLSNILCVQETITANLLFLGTASLIATGLVVCLLVGHDLCCATYFRIARQSGLLVCAVFLMSPLLQTLTQSISSDTVAASSCWLLAVHLFLNSYDFVHGVTDTLSGSLSLGAALGASVLLSSCLEDALQVAAQVSTSLAHSKCNQMQVIRADQP